MEQRFQVHIAITCCRNNFLQQLLGPIATTNVVAIDAFYCSVRFYMYIVYYKVNNFNN